MKKHFAIFTFLILFQQSISAQSTSAFSCGPIPALCSPGHVNPSTNFWIGIHYVQFAQINKTTSDTSGYQDYTCSDSTTLIQGNVYQFYAVTDQTYEECIRVWIDFSNDGVFDATEIVFTDSAIVFSHNGYVTIPVLGQINTPLRMRIASDCFIPPPINACSPVQNGNYIDFTIYFSGPDAISELQQKAVSIFPNPVSKNGKLTFQDLPNGFSNFNLKIYDAIGNIVSDEMIEMSQAIIRKNYLSPGIFYFHITSDSGFQSSGKFLVE